MAFKITLGTLGVTLTLDDAAFKKGMASAKKSLGGAASYMAKGMAAMGTAAAAGVGIAVNEWAKLEQSVMNAAAVSNMGRDAFGGFLDAAIKASSGTQFSAVEAGNALQYLSMAGFSAVDAVKALPGVLDLTTAANIDLAQAADITSDILTGMGMKVEDLGRVNDVLVKTFTTSNTNLEMLGNSFKYVGPVANAFKQDIETVAASLGIMANAGIKSDQAGRQLRMAMIRLVRPTRTTADAMKALGTSIGDKNGNFRDFIDVIRDLEEAQKKMTDVEFSKNLSQLFGAEALPGITELLKQGSEALEKYREDLKNAGGTAKEVADNMRSTLSNQIKILTGNIQNLAAKFGQVLAPAVSRINKRLADMVIGALKSKSAFRQMKEMASNSLRTFGALIKAFGVIGKVAFYTGGAVMEIVNAVAMLIKYIEIAAVVAGHVAGMDFSSASNTETFEAEMKLLAKDFHSLNSEYKELEKNSGSFMKTASKMGEAFDALATGVSEGAAEGADAIDALTHEEAKALAAAEALKQGLNDTKKSSDAAFDSMKDGAEKAAKGIDAARIAMEKAAKEAAKEAKAEAARRQKAAQKEKRGTQDKAWEQFGREAEAHMKVMAERQQRFEDFKKATVQLRKNAIDGVLEMASIVADAFAGGERSVLQPLMEGVSAFASNISGVVSGLTRASMGDLSGLASAGQAAASIVQAATAAFLRYATSHEDFQASIGVLRDQVAKLDLDVLGKFFNSFEGAIGVFLAVPELLAPLAHWGSLMDGVIDDYGRTLFDTIKRVAMAFLDFQVVLGELKIIIFNVGKSILGAYISMAKQLNETLGRIFRNFFIDWTGAEGKWMELNNSTENLRDGVDSAREAMDRLKGLTYEEAKASAAKAKEEWKAAEGLKELNSELRNAPSGFKRLAKMRYDAAAAQSSLEQRGVGLSSGGGMSSTQIANTLIAHFHGLTYEEGAKQVLAVAERAKFIRTGSKLTTPAQRHRTALRSGIRQAG